MATFDTAANIVSEAAIELGLGAVVDPYGSTDPNIILLRTLLKSVGRSLVWRYPWLQQVKEHSFVTTDGESVYDLPEDFQSFVDMSGFNRTTNVRMHPVSVQQWQELESARSQSTHPIAFRIRNTTLELWPQPPAADHTFAFEYRSKYWVQPSGETESTADAPSVNTDTVNLDAHLMTRALKLAFLKAKGFDTTAAQQDFDEAMNAVQGANSPSPVLPLSPRSGWLLNIRNVPETGFGFDDQGGLY